MIRLRSALVGVDQGELLLFSDFEEDGPMWRSEGPREILRPVAFAGAFLQPPSVTVALTMWDVSNAATARMDVQARDIRSDGFSILFRTWGDSRIARARAGWQAIGALPDPEIWQVD